MDRVEMKRTNKSFYDCVESFSTHTHEVVPKEQHTK